MVRNIRLTPLAAEKLREAQRDGKYYKVDLKRAGCCSFNIVFSQGRKKESDLLVETEEGLQIPVSSRAQAMLRNILIDYKKWGFVQFFNVIPT